MAPCTNWMMLVALVTLTFSAITQAAPPSPHLIFIVADDFGWNDVGYHNPDIISPTLDKLADSGIKLNYSYVQPVCSPSRTAFMTGVFPYKLGLQHLVIGERQDVCLPLNQTLFPQVLKSHGYSTHMIGKWHLGFCDWKCTPTYRGFDSFYGFYSGGEDHYSHQILNGYDLRLNETVDKEANGTYSAFTFAKRAETIIDAHDKDTPMYLYSAFQNVHMPLQVPDQYLKMYPNIKDKNRRELSAMVSALDDAILRIVKALQANDMYNNSIIVFSADNGGWTTFGGNNFPLRGGKVSIFEGGTRVPAFVHSPLLEKSGFTYNGMLHAVDWFPTLASALGINYKVAQTQDGIDQWKAITTNSTSKRNEFIYNLDYHPLPIQGQAAIRVGDFKLIDGYPGLYQGWYKPASVHQGFNHTNLPGYQLKAEDVPEIQSCLGYKYLFNLRDDPNEHNNLYDKMPDVVKALKDKMDGYMKQYVPPMFPANDPDSQPENYGGVWTPGWCKKATML